MRSHLVRSLVLVVDAAEIGDDDGYWQGNHQDAAEGADGAEDLPGDGVRDHVSVPAGQKDTVSLQSSPLELPAPQPSAILRLSRDVPGTDAIIQEQVCFRVEPLQFFTCPP